MRYWLIWFKIEWKVVTIDLSYDQYTSEKLVHWNVCKRKYGTEWSFFLVLNFWRQAWHTRSDMDETMLCINLTSSPNFMKYVHLIEALWLLTWSFWLCGRWWSFFWFRCFYPSICDSGKQPNPDATWFLAYIKIR